MFITRSFSAILILSLFVFSTCSNSSGNDRDRGHEMSIKDSVLVKNLNYPWELVWGPDNHIWMTERGGKVSRVNPTTGAVTLLINITDVVSNGEGGLLGMALHPSFSTDPYVYLAYDYDSSEGYREKIVRYTYNGKSLTSPLTLLDNIQASYIHNGCRLLIVGQKLFITTGDASNQSLPQNKNTLNGKIMRINLDGSIPSDNPFPNNPVWSYGHRNAQGLVYANNIMYSSEHGPANDDEINIIEKGRNYGWPNVEGFCNTSSERTFCSANNIKEPIKTWTPTAAVCGMDHYNSDRIPEWKNSLLVVALKNARLYQMKLGADNKSIVSTNEYFTNVYGRLRDVCVAPSGKVYICTSNGGNKDRIIVISQ